MKFKHFLYLLYIILAALVSAGFLSSCSVYHTTDTKGYTRIVTIDTSFVSHLGTFKLVH